MNFYPSFGELPVHCRCVLVVMWLCALPLHAEQARAAPTDTNSTTTTIDDDVHRLLGSMTIEQKVGQLLLLGFGGTVMDEHIAAFLDEMQPGAVALFSRNIKSEAQTREFIKHVHEHDPMGIPMFVAVDQEGGTVVRLKESALVLPSAMALGAAGSPALAKAAGLALGQDLLALGFNMNLAPVLDVNSNPHNPVIGIRSFGSDPNTVAAIGSAFAMGLQDAGVTAVAKHFPGHGDTDVDSHYHLPSLPHDRARLQAVELLPFTQAIHDGLDAVMTAHIALPNLDDTHSDLPATVNPAVLTGLLRETLGFDGLVVTDGLEMQGIVERFGSGEAAVRAIEAGADMVMVLWYADKKREVRQALLDAVDSGRITRARLDASVTRVLRTKHKRGLFAKDQTHLPVAKRAQLERRLARAAVTVVKGDDVLPLRGGAVLVAATEPVFAARLTLALGGTTLPLSTAPTRERIKRDTAQLLARGEKASVIVVGIQSGDYLPMLAQARTTWPNKRIVLVSFGSPYLGERAANVDAYVCAFGFRDSSERAAADVLSGRQRATGRMPVVLRAFAEASGHVAGPGTRAAE